MKLKRWLVFTEHPVNGTHWHAFWTREERRAFLRKHGGKKHRIIEDSRA